MNTGLVETWTGNITDLGPIYPLVGTEWLWIIVGVVFWIGWHIWQLRFESRTYDEEQERWKGDALVKAIREDYE